MRFWDAEQIGEQLVSIAGKHSFLRCWGGTFCIADSTLICEKLACKLSS